MTQKTVQLTKHRSGYWHGTLDETPIRLVVVKHADGIVRGQSYWPTDVSHPRWGCDGRSIIGYRQFGELTIEDAGEVLADAARAEWQKICAEQFTLARGNETNQ